MSKHTNTANQVNRSRSLDESMMLAIYAELPPSQKVKFFNELMELTLSRLAALSAKGGSNE